MYSIRITTHFLLSHSKITLSNFTVYVAYHNSDRNQFSFSRQRYQDYYGQCVYFIICFLTRSCNIEHFLCTTRKNSSNQACFNIAILIAPHCLLSLPDVVSGVITFYPLLCNYTVISQYFTVNMYAIKMQIN